MSRDQKRKEIKVLHVDDEPDFLALTKVSLERENENFSVDTAYSAEEGIELLKRGKYDVVVADYKMPAMDGLEFLQNLRASGNTIPFIMFTGKGREEVAIAALNKGANHYLQKGGDIKSMFTTLAHVIEEEAEKKRVEDKLAEVEKERQIILDYVRDVIWTMDMNLRFTYISPSIMRLTGHSVEEVMSLTLEEMLTPASYELAMKTLAEELTIERREQKDLLRSRTLEFELSCKDGSTIWVEAKMTFLRDAESQPVGILGVSRDITERKKAKDALRQAKEFSDSLIASMKDGFSVLDSRGVHIDVNPALCQMTGFSREELIGVGLPHPYWLPETEEVEKAFQKTLRGEFDDFELTFMRKDGERFPVIVSPSWIKDSRGNVISYFATVKDITERKAAEVALAASKAYTESIIQNFLDTLIVVDTEAKIQTANPATCHLLGYTEEELIGQPISIIFAEEEEEEEVHRFFQFFREPEKAEALRPQDTIRNRELTYKTKDGRLIPMSFNASVLIDEAGNVTGVVAGAKDITELKLAEAEMIKEKRFSENIVATVPDSLLVLDKDLRIKSANRTFYETFQTEPEKVIGSSIAEILQDTEGKLSTELTQLFGTEDMLENFELHYHSEKLGERIFNITARGILVAEEEEEEELLVIEDITEFKRLQEKEKEAAAMKKASETIDAMPDALIVLDLNGVILSVNPALTKMLGWKPEERVGKSFDELGESIKAEDIERFMKLRGEFIKTGHVEPVEAVLRAKDGREIPTSVTASLIKDAEGNPKNIIALLRDITEQKRAQEQVKASLREKEMLLEEIHHRVRNNLQLISGLLDLSSMRTHNQELVNLITDVRAKIHVMALIHNQLYRSERFDRIELGIHVREMVSYLSQVYENREKLITPIIVHSDVYLSVTQAIPCALVLNEVISNAFKHAFTEGQKGTIEISIQRSADDTIFIRVKDDGIGMPEGIDIYRAESLGLKLIRNLVQEQLKGKVQVNRDNGTEFIIKFKNLKK